MNYLKIAVLVVVSLSLTAAVIGQEAPDWARRDYPASADQVFAAALLSIQEQDYEVTSKDNVVRTVDFHAGITVWSWGYNMRLAVTTIDESHAKAIVGISRSGGKALSWGSGKKEVRRILAGIDAELTARKAGLR